MQNKISTPLKTTTNTMADPSASYTENASRLLSQKKRTDSSSSLNSPVKARHFEKSESFKTPTCYRAEGTEENSPVKEAVPFGKPLEIIADRLYWISDSKPPQNISNAFFFNIDNVSPL